MPDNKVKIDLITDGSKTIAEFSRTENKAKTFGESVKNVFSNISQRVDYAAQHIGAFGTALTALSTGVVLKKLFSVHDFIPIDDALLRMQANFNLTAKGIDGFKNKLTSMAANAGQDMDMLFAKATKLSVIYKPEDVLKIIEASSHASHAMGENVDVVTDRVVQLMKMYKKSPEEAKEIADSLVASRADMQSLDIMLQRGILKGGASKDYKEVLAIVGALKKTGAESPRVVTAVESILNAIEEKSQTLKASGIDIFKIDPNTGQKVKKDITEILESLRPVIAHGYKMLGKEKFDERLNRVFGAGAAEGIPFLLSQIDAIKKAKADQGNAAQIAGKLSAAADETWAMQLEKIKGSLAGIKNDLRFIYDLAKVPVKFLADHEGLTKDLGYGAAVASIAIGGGLIVKKAGSVLGGLAKVGGNLGSTATGIAAGKVLQAEAGVTPVFVTNWPGTFGNQIPLETGTLKDSVTKVAASGGVRSALALGGAAVGGGIVLGTGINYLLQKGGALDRLSQKINEAFPAHKGGSEHPGVKEHSLWSMVSEFANRNVIGKAEKTEVKNNVPINIVFGANGLAIAQSNDPNTKVSVTSLKRGDLFHG